MKLNSSRKLLSLMLVLCLAVLVVPVLTLNARAEDKVYTMTADDIAAFAAGAKADGDVEAVGTDGYFNVFYSEKTKVDASAKSFEDGVSVTNRISWGGNTDIGELVKNAIQIKTEGPATLKIWFVSGGDDREVAIFGPTGSVVAQTAIGTVKNSLYIAELEIAEAGTYYIGNVGGNNNYYKLEVTEKAAEAPAPTEIVYTLDTTLDLPAMAQGVKADGDVEAAGTENFFNIYYSSKTKIDSSSKTFDDGYAGAQRLNFGGKAQIGETTKNDIQFTTEGAATVKIWWVQGGDDHRQMGLFGADGTLITQTEGEYVKNSPYMSTLEIAEAGTYFLGGVTNNNNFYKVEVTVLGSGTPEKPARADWATVAAPVINSITVDEKDDGNLKVAVSALVGYDGADEVVVAMLDAEGNELATKRSIAEKGEHTLTFTPTASGTYTFVATLSREGEQDKTSAPLSSEFVYPLGNPILISATSKGAGKVEVIFSAVKEAEGYHIYIDGAKVAETTNTTCMVEGLTVGSVVEVKVYAIRGTEQVECASALNCTVTQEARQTWGFTVYGPSTNISNNGYTGSVNDDGRVTVFSEGGKGKIQPTSVDGLAFYYTAVPTEYNFTLRATVTVDSWTFSNGQEGFGLMATDRLGISGNTADFWNNSYLVGSTKIEYRYDSEFGTIYDISDPAAISFPKYSMKQGLGIVERTGVNKENLAMFEANDTNTINTYFSSITKTFETTAGYYGYEAGTYNVIGNATGTVQGTLDDFLMTTFVLEIQKNNTGYFLSYYDTEGNLIAREKFYEPEALSQLDEDNVYVGFFASRNARATFSNIHFDTILASEDAPAEERPIEYIVPTVSIVSPTVTTELGYRVEVDTNVNGTLKVSLNGKVLVEGVEVKGLVRYLLEVTLDSYGENNLVVTFTPDPDQDLGEYTELATTQNQSQSITIMANKGFYHNKVVYVSPTGLPNGNGTKEYPLDIYTAVDNAIPGQTIVIMEGTYRLIKTVRIQRGMDGTAEEPVRMIADPEAKTRPVFDFQGECAGFVHGGDYWYFYGFDVTRSADMQKGFQVSGNHNTLDQINTYYNGNTGIQISRYTGTDLFPDWPSYNLILNCTSYCNYDAGFEDADGFAAKLTCGEGNVFDGCVAYNNADDGWDLYAKVETGSIGAVVIRNCVAYANGYVPGIEGKTGNGNGFKMGGSSLSGKHQLINSYAFYNLAKGIDSNSCPDVTVHNSISYNNGSYNVAFYTNAGANTAFVADGIISFKDADITNQVPGGLLDRGEQLKGKGTQVTADYNNATTYYWNGTACQNAAGTTLTADIFESLEFKGIKRKADGTIDMQGFLLLTESAPEDAGARPDGEASADNSTLPEDLAHDFSSGWHTHDNDLHWRECECGFKTDMGEHEYEYVIDQMPTEFVTGWKHRECKVCGKQGPKIEMYYDEIAPTPEPEPEPETPDEPVDEPKGLPAVAIVFIVLGSIVALGGGGFLAWKFLLPKFRK
nr:right-handed parallel beta-helix repeat-containing protein [Clostridia bacterium]